MPAPIESLVCDLLLVNNTNLYHISRIVSQSSRSIGQSIAFDKESPFVNALFLVITSANIATNYILLKPDYLGYIRRTSQTV